MTVGDNVYNATVKDGKAVIDLVNETPGTYSAVVKYSGDKDYAPVEVNKTVTIPKYETPILVEVNDVAVGQTATVTVTLPENATGNVIIEIDGVKYTNATDKGVAVFNIDGLLAGNKTVAVTYAGDKWYVYNSTTAQFKVTKVATSVNITVTDHYVDEAFEIEIQNETAVVVTINGKEYSVVNGKVSVGADDLAAGHYIVTATVVENNMYLTASTTKEFNILKRNSTVKATVDSIKVGDVAVINITVPDDMDATVTVSVNGTNYTVNIVAGTGSLELKDLSAGSYDIEVVYAENAKYLTNSNATTLDVSKVASSVTVNVANITVGDVALVNITVTEGATGNVTIKIGDEFEQTVGVTSGEMIITVAGLTVGDKTVAVTYNGDGKYMPSNDSANFTVGKSASAIRVVVENVTYGEVETVVAYIDAEGNVTFKLNGVEIETVKVENGVANYAFNLDAGNYTVEVIYNGNDGANSTSTTANFTVEKADPVITVEVADIVYGDSETIIILSNAEGSVNVTVNGKSVVVPLNDGSAVLMASRWDVPKYDGKATVVVPRLNVGKYPVNVTFSGNENYNAITVTALFNVIKKNTTVDVEVKDSIPVDESVSLNITVDNINATGVVVITVGGENFTATLEKGTVKDFTIGKLKAGNYTVVVIYGGDDNLNGNWTAKSFEVVKHDSYAKVNATSDYVGNDVVIEVEVPKDATGSVIVSVDGNNYTVEVKDGIATLTVKNLANGTYDVTATYMGDENYTSSVATGSFKVDKVQSSINLTVSNSGVFVEGMDVDITINAPADATGKVEITLTNETESKSYVVYVNDGVGVLHLETPGIGNYTVIAKYLGDNKYNGSDAQTKFSVNATDKEIVVNTTPITDYGDESISISVSGDHVGENVTVVVKDADGNVVDEQNVTLTDYMSDTNSSMAKMKLDNLQPGKYTVEAIYREQTGTNVIEHIGCDTFELAKSDSNFTVKNITDILVGESVTIELEINSTATGNITVYVNGVEYNTTTDKLVITIPDLPANEYVVNAYYYGDGRFNSSFDSKTFKVSKRPVAFNVTADTSTEGYATIKLTELPGDATGYVIVNVNGTKYAVDITDTKEVTVPAHVAGQYNVVASYLGDDRYESANAETFFVISKSTTDVDVEIKDTVAGGDMEVKVTIPADATGNITVTVGNETKTVPADGGENTIVISNMTEGNQTVTVTYSGDGKYNSTTVIRNVTVRTSINVVDKLTRGINSPYDYEAEFLNKDGTVLKNTDVQFIVNGKTYTVKTDDKGIARLTASKLGLGTYNVTSINPVTGQQVTKELTIVKRLINNKDVTMDFSSGKAYTVKVIGDDGKAVGEGEFIHIYVNKMHYVGKTDKNGIVKLVINLNPGKYKITAEYKHYKVANKIKVKQILKLVKKTVKVKKGKKLKIKVKLKWSNGKPLKGKKITIKFKGKKYKAKTNKKGIAKVIIKKKVTKKLKKGKKYKYTATYKTDTVKGKVKVKK